MKAQEKDAKRLFGTHKHTYTLSHTHSISVRCQASKCPSSSFVNAVPSWSALLPSQRRRAQNKSRSEQITRVVFLCVSFSRADMGEWASSATSWPAIALSNWTSWLTHSRSALMCSLVFYSSTASPRSKMCVQLRTMGPGK